MEDSRNDQTLISRRQILGGAAVLGAATIAGGAHAFPVALGERPASLEVIKVAGTPSGTVVLGVTQEAVNFNPLLYVNTGIDTIVEVAVFDSPWTINEKGEFVANLATEVPSVENGGISADGLDWTIKLRTDVKWHDSQPFTARDVLFTYQTIMNPAVAVRSRAGHDQVAEISAPDDHTVKIKLKQPFVPYLVTWQKTSIIPEHLLKGEADLNTAAFNTNPVGTGPFRFKNRVAGDYIEYEANPDYHGDGPHIQTYIQKFVPDQQALFAQFQTGQVNIIDLQGIPPELFGRAKALPGKEVFPSPSTFVEFVYFNCGKPQFADKRVRQALYLAMDKQAIIDQIYAGVPVRSLSYLPPDHWAYNKDLQDPGFDTAKAAALLDEAGWAVGADGVREKDDVKLAFTISTTSGNKSRERAQQLLQQNFKSIGVDMTLNNMPASVVWGDYTVKSEFDTLMVAWDPLLFPDPDYSDRIASDRIPAKGGNGANYVQFQNAEIDELCRRGLNETVQEKRKAIYDRIQAILLDELPFAPILGYTTLVAKDAAVKGYGVNPYHSTNTWNCNSWTIES